MVPITKTTLQHLKKLGHASPGGKHFSLQYKINGLFKCKLYTQDNQRKENKTIHIQPSQGKKNVII